MIKYNNERKNVLTADVVSRWPLNYCIDIEMYNETILDIAFAKRKDFVCNILMDDNKLHLLLYLCSYAEPDKVKCIKQSNFKLMKVSSVCVCHPHQP